MLGGLKSALERGEPLQKAMIALYNSGYKKEDIEEAAQHLIKTVPSAKSLLSELEKFSGTVPSANFSPKPLSQQSSIKQTEQVKDFPVKDFPVKKLTPEKPVLQLPKSPEEIPSPVETKPQWVKVKKEKPVKLVPQMDYQPFQNQNQKVSRYKKIEDRKSRRDKAIIIGLIILLLFLLGGLALIFFYRKQLVEFLSNYFV